MTDVNEEIVRQYFELKGYFVQTDVLYLKPKGKTGKKSSGYGDIDLIILNPRTGDKAIVGVSGWHRERVTPSYVEGWEGRLFSHLHPLALKKASEVLSSKDFRKILVISRMGSKEKSRKVFEQKAYQQGIDEIIDFPTILKELIRLIKTEPSYDSEVLQTLRLLKIYDLLKV